MNSQATRKLTYDDYVLIPDDGLRHEIIDGEHFVNAAPNVRHQLILVRLLTALSNFAKKHKLGEVFCSPIDVLFSQYDVVQPDIIYIRHENTGELEGAAFVKMTPDLVVEILSSNRKYDEVKKLRVYDEFSVPEYWIVDQFDNLVNIFRRQTASLTLVEKVELGGRIASPLFPGFSLSAKRLFAPV